MSRPEQAVFRLPVSALFIPVGLFVFATPLASASVWTVALYLLPIYGLIYVLVTRTVADDRTITARTPISRRRIAWADLDGFEFQGQRWAIAVTLEGRRIRLPMVRPRDLRRLAEVSGGRLYLGEDASTVAEAADAESAAVTTMRAGGGAEAAAGASATDGQVTDGQVTDGQVTDGSAVRDQISVGPSGTETPPTTGEPAAAEVDPESSVTPVTTGAKAPSRDDTVLRTDPAE